MYQFFVEDESVAESRVMITGADVNHIKNVLRMRPGERIRVCTRGGRALLCAVAEMSDTRVLADILEDAAGETELPNRIFLFQGLPKGDKMELIVQKAVELGAHEIIPVAMKNCVVRLDEKKAAAKTARWRTIAESAAKQSKRGEIPLVRNPMTLKEALSHAAGCDVRLVMYENARGMESAREAVGGIRAGQSVAVFIGPEGGFAPEEIALVSKDARPISLGRRILRTETAAIAALAILEYSLEE